jgi:hypothetical protein
MIGPGPAPAKQGPGGAALPAGAPPAPGAFSGLPRLGRFDRHRVTPLASPPDRSLPDATGVGGGGGCSAAGFLVRARSTEEGGGGSYGAGRTVPTAAGGV